MIKPRNDRNLNPRDGKWFLDFTFRGKRIRQFGGYSKEQARNALAKLRIEKLDEKLGFKKPEVERVLFEDFAEEFLELYSRKNRRPNTVLSHENSIAHLKEAFAGKYLDEITAEMIERYKAARCESTYKREKATKGKQTTKASVNRELECLKKMYAVAVEWKRVEANPAAPIKKFKAEEFRPRILSNDEIARLLAVASSELRPILTVALNTGMRKNEILTLRWENINLLHSVITVPAADAKSGKSRQVPMNEAVISALKAQSKTGPFVFMNGETGSHFNSVKTAFHGACRRARKDPENEKDPGIVGVRFHDLRHTAATKMIEAGVNIVTVSKILGHASIEITYQRYCHPSPEDMKSAVDRLAVILQRPDNPGKNLDIEQDQAIKNLAKNALSNYN